MKRAFPISLALLLVLTMCPVAYAEPTEGSADQGASGQIADAQKKDEPDGSKATDDEKPTGETQDSENNENGAQRAAPSNGQSPEGYSVNSNDISLLAESEAVSAGVYIVKSALGTSVDIAGGSSNRGANVQTYSDNNTPAQRFALAKTSDGYYTIKNISSGKVLDVQNGTQRAGANVWQYDPNGTAAQKWSFAATGDGDGSYYIKPAFSSKFCLDVANGHAGNGANVQIWDANETKAQKFYLVEQKRSIDDGYYTVASSLNANKVLDISNGSAVDGGNVQLWSANNTAAQRFQVTYDTSDGYYTIRNVSSNKVLDVQSGQSHSGANVWQYSSNGTAAQKWTITQNSDKSYTIRSGCSGHALDVAGASTADGANVQVYAGNKTPAQKWTFKETKPVDEGVFVIQSAFGTVLDATNGGSSNGTRIQTFSSNGTFAQKYQLQYAGNGYYRILAINSTMALDVQAAGKANGTPVQLYDSNKSDAQLWKPIGAGSGYFYLQSKCNGKVMDIANGSTAKGAKVQVFDSNGTNAQRFKFVGTPLIPDGSYTIASALDSNSRFVLDIAAGSASNGASVQLYASNNTAAQKFNIVHLGNGYYSIAARCSNKLLDVKNAFINSSGIGALQQWESNGNAAQKWKAQVAGNGYFYFVSALNSASCMNVTGAAANATAVNVAKKTDSAAQRFKLSPASAPASETLSISLDTMTKYQLTNLYVTASYSEVYKRLNPASYSEGTAEFNQFADVRGYSGMTAAQLDSYITSTANGRSGKLKGLGYAFVAGAKQHGLNESYLLAHAILESGWGTSELANGYYYPGGVIDGKSYPAGTYYNFYGIGAYDSSPLSGGRKHAIINGWNTPEKAVTGAAKWIATNYVYRTEYPQPTLYNMKWDYLRSNDKKERGYHQYATDIAWPTSIAVLMGACYSHNGVAPSLAYIVPKYA